MDSGRQAGWGARVGGGPGVILHMFQDALDVEHHGSYPHHDPSNQFVTALILPVSLAVPEYATGRPVYL
jgi:hypothetical protein